MEHLPSECPFCKASQISHSQAPRNEPEMASYECGLDLWIQNAGVALSSAPCVNLEYPGPTHIEEAIEDANFEKLTDGNTIWINDRTGFCIGRFSKLGIDIHHNLEDQQKHGKQCLACTHTKPDLDDWQNFKNIMKEHYSVTIEDQMMPEFLRT